MVTGRTLGDVPGIEDLLNNRAGIYSGYSVSEVDALGQITARDAGLGDASQGMGAGADPFAYDVGFLDREQQGGTGGGTGPDGPGYVAQYGPLQSSYLPSLPPISAPVTGTTAFDAEQVENAQVIATVGKKLGATERDIQVALMAAIVESGLRSLDYGDRDSIGLFQQRDAWGSREDRLNPAKAAAMFFLGGNGGQQGLLDIKDRDKRGLGDLAQDVQVSAYPGRYSQHESEAASLLTTIRGGKDPYGLTERDGETIDNLTAAALDAAAKEFGSDFSIMQGGHSNYGPSGGTHSGLGVVDVSVPNGDWVGAMTALRKIGFAAWVRNVPGFGQAGEGAHIHAVLIGDEKLSPQAQTQVQSYLNNDDGLEGTRPDDGPRDFVNNRFVWGAPEPKGPTWRDKVVKDAQTFLGAPFRWGGRDYDGVDSPGLLKRVYKELGLNMPDDMLDMDYLGDPVEVEKAEPGDLIAWDNNPDSGLGFGIYLGNGRYVEAGGPGRVVQLNDIGIANLNFWAIPMQDAVTQRTSAPRRTSPFRTSPSPPPVSSSGAPLQGQMNAPVTRGSKPRKPDPHGPLQSGVGALNPDKPRPPM